MTQLVRVQNFSVSADGYGAGTDQSFEAPFGRAVGSANEPSDLVSWLKATAGFPFRSEPGGSRGLDDYFARDFDHGIGAEIMGRNKFGPQRGPWENLDWNGWWGDVPPFHTPVFVLTHHVRPDITLSDTTFRFIDATPADALAQARAAADGKDVRIGGGTTTVREFLDADLIDTMHVVVVPIELGSGVRPWKSPDELNDRYHHETVPSASGVVHHIYWRR